MGLTELIILLAIMGGASIGLTGCTPSKKEEEEDGDIEIIMWDDIKPKSESETINPKNEKSEIDYIEAVETCEEEYGQPCVCGALVQCTSAKDKDETVHITKYVSGVGVVKVAQISQLDEEDIRRDKAFSGCKNTDNGKCFNPSDDGYVIEGDLWQDINKDVRLEPDGGTLDADRSYMICLHGQGLIYFKDSGQEFKDAIFQEAYSYFGQIENIRIIIYDQAKSGGIEAVKKYIAYYYTDDIIDYFDAIGMREGSGDYNTTNKTKKYLGKYQLGPETLQSIGWMDSTGKWTEKAGWFGVSSKDDFLGNPTAQDVAMTFNLRYIYMFHKQKGVLNMVGTSIEGYVTVDGKLEKREVEVTLSGLLAASHLVGIGDVYKAYRNETSWFDLMDEKGTYATDYMYQFANYDIKKILGYISNDDEVGIE